MRATTRLFILHDVHYMENGDGDDVEQLLYDHGSPGEILVCGHKRLIVSAPIEKAEAVRDILDMEGAKTIDLPEPSGRRLTVNFCYRETGQVCSATVDERHWAIMTAETSPVTMADAFVALYQDVEIHGTYSPEDDFEIQDIMNEVSFWTPEDARWDPELWADDEPMATITFTAQADLAGNGGTVAVDIPALGCSEVSWEMPVRLIPDRNDQVGHDDLAFLPCAPEAVRAWARVAPFELEVEFPELESSLEM